MTRITKFVAKLHNSDLVLYCPLEWCLFVNKPSYKSDFDPYFFYFGSPEALHYRITKLQR